MVVYVLSIVWQFDSGECGSDVLVYDSIEKAEKQLKREIKNAKKDMAHFDIDETQFVDGDMSYSIWEKENYCYNHIDIAVTESQVY